MRTRGWLWNKRLKAFERENQPLKRRVADQALDITASKDVADGKFS